MLEKIEKVKVLRNDKREGKTWRMVPRRTYWPWRWSGIC